MGTDDRAFASLLRGMRAVAGLTQDELAERAGLSVRGLRYLEQGARRPYPETIRRIADALGVSARDREVLLASGRRPSQIGGLRGAHGGGRLPAPPSPLIGREADLAGLFRLLADDSVRTVTITGSGGVGKTRLAMEVAVRIRDNRADVAWVALANLSDSDRVPAAIAQALDVMHAGSVSAEDAVSRAIGDDAVVLVLDNVEHLLDVVGFLGRLLARCPAVTILATSRATLRLPGEHEFPLAALPVPPVDDVLPVHALAANPAVDLFLRRAQAVRPQFTLTQANAEQIAAICHHLDGLPLAIELAAARIRVLSPTDMLTRLRQRQLAFLTGGATTAPPRHRTMRAAIDWSYQLLHPSTRAALRGLCVFHGGCTLDAAEAVLGGREPAPVDVLGAVEDLHRNSLLTVVDVDGDEVRLHILQTIREYGLDQLRDSGEYADLRRAHARYFLAFAEDAARHYYPPDTGRPVTGLAQDDDNLRAAIRWSIEQRDTDTALRLAAALWSFWYVRGQITEGRAHLARILELAASTAVCPPLARALLGAGQLALAHGDYAQARTLLDRSLAAHRELDEGRGTAEALLAAGFAARLGDRPDDAGALLDQALAQATATGHEFITAAALHHLGMLATTRGDHHQAGRLLEDSLARYGNLRLHRFIALVTLSRGQLALATGDTAAARDHLHTSLTAMRELQARLDIPAAFETAADLAAANADPERAVQLAAAAASHRAATGTQPWPDAQHRRDQWLTTARAHLGNATYATAWAIGQHMSLDDAAARVY